MTKPAARDKPAETSVMTSALPEDQPQVSLLQEVDKFVDAAQAADRESELAALVKADSATRESELSALVRAMQARLDQLEGRQNESYGDDDKLFIAKSAGEQWSERKLNRLTKSYEDVQMQATAFFGPFNTPEAIAAYLNAKKGKRAGDYMEWEDVRTVTGREKRKIEANERADREDQGLVPKIPQYFGGR